jgi:aspartyl-tRNA(Asn)/glutamyl-tRNA(Gln) amidotransferase subunit C
MSAEPAASRISREEVAHLARLARLAVTDAELDVFAGQLEVILGAVARVGEVAADDIPPTSHAEDGRFRVPQILGEEA